MTDLHLTPQPPVDVKADLAAGQRAMFRLSAAVADSPLSATIHELVNIRASQINGCAFCLEMHHHDAVERGETAERLALLPAWRESELYTHEERLALALTEAVTRIADGPVPTALEAEARRTFDTETYAALIYAIVTINAWNRLSVVGHTVPGSMRAVTGS
ncbi:carboxymuconolactone decarboxylase family protein [Aquihabitans sp. G128]|uniref:carboxymuconolactone decarboxylase family protein n=1 Tax=Aquihabitans sp. G128 TaxID=2849779 RepID=UPI001C244ABD|nr:carboxymuconolactone decarboxylase family protein [Aquihabitans sp. G128]QXC60862.1 carboxymuconolactone decarboxylase family protein [Aquihabitans sp. G128]